VLVLSGYGIRLDVERGYLIVEDGVGATRHRQRLSKLPPAPHRVVALGHSGVVSLQALRWLHDRGAAFVHIDSDGQLVAAVGPQADDTRLRRAQSLATLNGTGMGIARYLVGRKIDGQAALADRLTADRSTSTRMRAWRDQLKDATTPAEILRAEAQVASLHWEAWQGIEVRFVRRDRGRVPDHWRTFGARVSPLTRSPRRAVNPANATLNYLYAVVEAEARIAALAMGLDPALGFLHADQPTRDSLACDLMEAVRPEVDAYVLNLLREREFSRHDFFELRDGGCRVMPQFAKDLSGTGPHWGRLLGPIAEHVATQLLRHRSATPPAPRGTSHVPTRLTQRNRKAGREKQRRAERPEPAVLPPVTRACIRCGLVLENRAKFCPDCRKEYQANSMTQAHAALRRRRALGADPAHGGKARRKRSVRNSEVQKANLMWERAQARIPEPEEFGRTVLPKLRAVRVGQMAQASGLSWAYCSKIKKGQYMPHPRHWASLQALA
jgi:CRISPR-associated endonuclease Cas1